MERPRAGGVIPSGAKGVTVSRTQTQSPARASAGDLGAFTLTVERYRAPLISYVYGILGSKDQAEELAQETFCRAWQHLPALRRPERLVSWLYQTAHNLAVSTLRRPRLAALPDELSDGRSAVPADDHTAEVHRAVNELPEAHRVVVALRHFSGMSHEQIAAALAIPEGTVRSRLSRAYDKLRDRLQSLLEV